jgi:beta-lactamase regulating signal transducer with metallopeptidase domain
MEKLLYNFSQVLGITVLHSLWQGLLIWLVLYILFLALPSLSSSKKHNLSFIALFSVAMWFSYTFYTEALAHTWNLSTTATSSIGTTQAIFTEDSAALSLSDVLQNFSPGNYKSELYNALKDYLPYISILYAIGLIINLFNLLSGWNKIRVIKQSLIAAEQLQEYVNRLSRQLHIRKYIQVNYTEFVDVPCVIGFFKPILLLPLTFTTQLSTAEIEAILLHEITHIKNNDYLLNILQQIVSVLLFFNPFAQFINRIVSKERENKCDDMVVETSIDPLIYARALLKLEETRQVDLKLALAATGKSYNLLSRIERIMKAKKPMVNIRHLVLAVILFIGSLVSISWLNPETKSSKIISKNVAKVIDKLTELVIEKPIVKEEDVMSLPPRDLKENIQPDVADTVPKDTVSIITGVKGLGKKPLVLIDDKEYDPEILYRISARSISSIGVFTPRSSNEKAIENKKENTSDIRSQNGTVNGLTKDNDTAQTARITLHRPSKIDQYGEKAKDGLIEIRTRNGIVYMDDTERENIIKERSIPKNQFYSRITLKNADGSLFDKVKINWSSGGNASTEITHSGKAAFLIDGKIYTEEEVLKFDQFRINEITKNKSGGVGKASLYDIPSVDLSGYEALFFFAPEFPPQKQAVQKSF